MNMEGLRPKGSNQGGTHTDNLIKGIKNGQDLGLSSIPKDHVIRSLLAKQEVNHLPPITAEQVLAAQLTMKQTENLRLTVQSIAGQLFRGDVTPKNAAMLLVEQSKRYNIPINEVRNLSKYYVKQHPYKTSLETGETLNVREAIEKHQQNVEAERHGQLQAGQGFSKKSQGNDTITSTNFSGNTLGQSAKFLWQQASERRDQEVYAARAYPTSLETRETLNVQRTIEKYQQSVEAERHGQLHADQKFSKEPRGDGPIKDKKEDKPSSDENSVNSLHQLFGGVLSKLASYYHPGPVYDGSSSTSSTNEGGSPKSSSHEEHEHHHEKHHHQHYRHMFPTGWLLHKGYSFNGLAKQYNESRHDESRHKLEALASQLGLENLAEFLGVRENSGVPESSKDWEDLDEPVERLLERIKEIREHTSGMPRQKLGVLNTLKHMLGLKLDHLPDFVANPDGTTSAITDKKAAELGKAFMVEDVINDFQTARSLLDRLYPALKEDGVIIDWEYHQPHDETYVGKDIIRRYELTMRMGTSIGGYNLQAFEKFLADRREAPSTLVGSSLDKCIFRFNAAIGRDFEKNAATDLNNIMGKKNTYAYAGTLNDVGASCVLAASIKAMNMKNKLLHIFVKNIRKIHELQKKPSLQNGRELESLARRYQTMEKLVSEAEKIGALEKLIDRFAKRSKVLADDKK